MKSVLKFHYFVDDKAVIQPGTKCSPRSHSSLRKRGLTPNHGSWILHPFMRTSPSLSHHSTLVHEFVGLDSTFDYFFMEQSLKLKSSLLLYQNGSFWQLSAHAPTPGWGHCVWMSCKQSQRRGLDRDAFPLYLTMRNLIYTKVLVPELDESLSLPNSFSC